MESIKVSTFGNFTLSYKGNHISDATARTRKIWAFLQYLVENRDRKVPEAEFVQALWTKGNSTNPANALKTLLFRVRGLLDELKFPYTKELIMHRQGCYFFNPKFRLVVDNEQFCSTLATQNKTEKTRLASLKKAITIYKGEYLHNSRSDEWTKTKRQAYYEMYLAAVYEAIDIYKSEHNLEEVIDLCKRVTDIDPYNEHMQVLYIKFLVEAKYTGMATKHYEYVTDLFFSKLGTAPSTEFTQLYRDITKSENIFQPDLTIIREELETPAENGGAIFCEYEMFREYYSITARSAERFNLSAHLCLFTVKAEGSSIKTVNTVMDKLYSSIQSSLRHSDIYTRYSVMQFLVFLSGSSYENSTAVANRVISAFKKLSFRKNITVEFSLRPMMPINEVRIGAGSEDDAE